MPGAETVKAEVRMPVLEKSPRWVMFETFGPHRKKGISAQGPVKCRTAPVETGAVQLAEDRAYPT